MPDSRDFSGGRLGICLNTRKFAGPRRHGWKSASWKEKQTRLLASFLWLIPTAPVSLPLLFRQEEMRLECLRREDAPCHFRCQQTTRDKRSETNPIRRETRHVLFISVHARSPAASFTSFLKPEAFECCTFSWGVFAECCHALRKQPIGFLCERCGHVSVERAQVLLFSLSFPFYVKSFRWTMRWWDQCLISDISVSVSFVYACIGASVHWPTSISGWWRICRCVHRHVIINYISDMTTSLHSSLVTVTATTNKIKLGALGPIRRRFSLLYI